MSGRRKSRIAFCSPKSRIPIERAMDHSHLEADIPAVDVAVAVVRDFANLSYNRSDWERLIGDRRVSPRGCLLDVCRSVSGRPALLTQHVGRGHAALRRTAIAERLRRKVGIAAAVEPESVTVAIRRQPVALQTAACEVRLLHATPAIFYQRHARRLLRSSGGIDR
jgi:hypothetical protein